MQEYGQDPMTSDSDDAQKIRQAEQSAIRKRKVKTPASFTLLSSFTISKASSSQFWNASFQNGYSPPIPTKKVNLNTVQSTPSIIPSTTPLTIPSDSPERPKVQTPARTAESKATGEKTVLKFKSTTKQTELEDKVSYNSFSFNIELINGFQNLKNR